MTMKFIMLMAIIYGSYVLVETAPFVWGRKKK